MVRLVFLVLYLYGRSLRSVGGLRFKSPDQDDGGPRRMDHGHRVSYQASALAHPDVSEVNLKFIHDMQDISTQLRGKHIVFIGDSTMRYGYLNLAHHLLHRQGYAPHEFWEGALVKERHGEFWNRSLSYGTDWAEWFKESTGMLQSESGSEVCDCLRQGGVGAW